MRNEGIDGSSPNGERIVLRKNLADDPISRPHGDGAHGDRKESGEVPSQRDAAVRKKLVLGVQNRLPLPHVAGQEVSWILLWVHHLKHGNFPHVDPARRHSGDQIVQRGLAALCTHLPAFLRSQEDLAMFHNVADVAKVGYLVVSLPQCEQEAVRRSQRQEGQQHRDDCDLHLGARR